MLAWAAMETMVLDDKWALPGVSRDTDTAGSAKPAAPTIAVGSAEPAAPTLSGLSAPSAKPAEPEASTEAAPRAEKAASAGTGLNLLSIAVGVVGLAALGVSLWVYADTQRELKRVSTDIAQIRVSLELFGKHRSGGGTAAVDATSLADIANRLALLEANQRLGGNASTAPAALPAIAGDSAPTEAAANGGDCLPSGMRFMVSAGDNYPVCGSTGSVAIAAVDAGYITLGDGTVIAQGATVGLPGTKCMVGLLPSEGDAITGFAEIRVTC